MNEIPDKVRQAIGSFTPALKLSENGAFLEINSHMSLNVNPSMINLLSLCTKIKPQLLFTEG